MSSAAYPGEFGRRGGQTGAERPPQVSWVEPSGLISLALVNAVLKVITLGVYQFWGKTEVRKRVWSAIRIEGEPLAYTGTGGELFKGFAFVFGVVLLPLLVLQVAISGILGPRAAGLGYVLILVPLTTYLFWVGVYRAHRYRLTRTSWRGIRGSLVGNSWHFGWTSLWTAVLIPVTLGWIYPWRATRLQRLLVDDMRFGDTAFGFVEDPGPLYSRFIALWVGGVIAFAAFVAGSAVVSAAFAVPAVGRKASSLAPEGVVLILVMIALLYFGGVTASSWYRAGQFNHFARSTSLAAVPLNGTMTGLGLLGLTLTNLLIVVVSLGVLAPLTQARSARYFLTHLTFAGAVPFETIAQGVASAATTGEGLAQAFDFDAF